MSTSNIPNPATPAVPAQLSAFERRARSVAAFAQDVKIVTEADYENAAEYLKTCKLLEKEIAEFMSPIVRAAHEAHKAAKERENSLIGPIREASLKVSRVMGAFREEAERQLRIEQQIALERARAEQQAAVADYADSLAAEGMETEAQAVLKAVPAIEIEHVQVANNVPHVKGTSARKTWKFEIVNSAAIPRQFLIPDERAIGALVRAQGAECNIPGVRVWAETIVSARGV